MLAKPLRRAVKVSGVRGVTVNCSFVAWIQAGQISTTLHSCLNCRTKPDLNESQHTCMMQERHATCANCANNYAQYVKQAS